MTEYILTAVIFGGGYFFQSLFGFGASFIVVLGLSLVIPVQSVIGILPISLIVAAGVVVLRDPGSVKWKSILKIVLVSCPGVIIGAAILKDLNSGILIIAIFVLILIYSIYSLLVEKVELPKFLIIPYLLMSGFVIGTTGLGIIYVPLVMQKIKKPAEIRASLHLLWILLGALRMPFYIQGGILTGRHLLMGLSVIPFILISQYFGKRVHDKLHTETYQRGLLIFLGLIVIIRLTYQISSKVI